MDSTIFYNILHNIRQYLGQYQSILVNSIQYCIILLVSNLAILAILKLFLLSLLHLAVLEELSFPPTMRVGVCLNIKYEPPTINFKHQTMFSFPPSRVIGLSLMGGVGRGEGGGAGKLEVYSLC